MEPTQRDERARVVTTHEPVATAPRAARLERERARNAAARDFDAVCTLATLLVFVGGALVYDGAVSGGVEVGRLSVPVFASAVCLFFFAGFRLRRALERVHREEGMPRDVARARAREALDALLARRREP